MIEIQREPTHPGEILKEEFLKPFNISQTTLAKKLHTSFRAINEIINQKRGITIDMALRLSKFFGTSPQLWLNLQNNYDLYKTIQKKQNILDDIKKVEEVA